MYTIFSKNKLSLLQLFFSNPNSNYYLQEIGKIFGKKGGVYQRSLNDLEQAGIITSFYRGNLRFFQVNRNYSLYNEVCNITMELAGEFKVKHTHEVQNNGT